MKKNQIIIYLFLFFFLSSCIFLKKTSSKDVEEEQLSSSAVAFLKGSKLFRKSNLGSARSQFEKLHYGDRYFVPALLEIQKINYLKGDWNRFFGLAKYYRARLLSSYSLSKEHFKEDFLTLEILALAQHCRFEEARKISKWSLQMANKMKKKKRKLKKVTYFLDLEEIIGDKNKKNLIPWDKRRDLWPLEYEKLKILDNPKNVRVKVDNQC